MQIFNVMPNVFCTERTIFNNKNRLLKNYNLSKYSDDDDNYNQQNYQLFALIHSKVVTID